MNRIRDYQGRIFSGLLIILIGVLFLLGNLGKLDIGEVFSTYWPLILVFIGLWHLIAHEFRRTGFAVILILIGAFFMLVNLDVIRGRVWIYFWPLLIIAVGLWLIFKPRFKLFREKAPEIKEKDLDAFIIFSGIPFQTKIHFNFSSGSPIRRNNPVRRKSKSKSGGNRESVRGLSFPRTATFLPIIMLFRGPTK